MVLGITADRQALLRKARDRLGGAFLGGCWVAGTSVLVLRIPHLSLLLGAVFLETFLAAHQARTSTTHSYMGLQMGLVLCMVLPVPEQALGSLGEVGDRLFGVILALGVNLVVLEVWPSATVKTGNPATPGTDVRSG